MSNDNSIFGLLTGIAVGAGLGILFAPDKGSTTRQKLSDGAVSAKDALEAEALLLKENALRRAELLKHNVADTLQSKGGTLEEKLDSIITDASYKADDVISNLEMRLRTLKEKNKKLQTNKTMS